MKDETDELHVTLWGRAFEDVEVTSLVKIFTTFCGTRLFIIAFASGPCAEREKSSAHHGHIKDAI
jgi:hypothetical protein